MWVGRYLKSLSSWPIRILSPMEESDFTGTRFQDLPEDICAEILSYVPLTELAPLYSECLLLNNTVRRIVINGTRNLPQRITTEIQRVKAEMQTSSAMADSSRLDFSTVLTYLRCMLTEAALLRATVGHYMNNESALKLLVKPLCQILEEFHSNFATLKDSTIRTVVRADYSSPGVPNWNNFLKSFDPLLRNQIEEASGIVLPLGVIIADLLHCSVSSNLQSNFTCTYPEDNYSLKMFFQLKDVNHKAIPPNFNKPAWSDADRQIRFIKYLRSFIRYENRFYLCKQFRELNDLENLIVLSGPNIVLDDVFQQLQQKYSQIRVSPFQTISRFTSPPSADGDRYNEMYYRTADWDLSKTCMNISLTLVADKKYVPLDYNYRMNELLGRSRQEFDASSYSCSRETLPDTMTGTLVRLSDVPRVEHALTLTTNTSEEFYDVDVCVRYDTSYFSTIFSEAEIVLSKKNDVLTFSYGTQESTV